ncbi:unnamed protein product [Blepharisma stoltei]|uniref:non-specific serine/threonine protein kinase n=1 Tax=Blepharisma stoltei TaxID=1481888 RepID=A0AAU9JY77_9CILI|nr:unnamed protein product [Blepharisma stoltei]
MLIFFLIILGCYSSQPKPEDRLLPLTSSNPIILKSPSKISSSDLATLSTGKISPLISYASNLIGPQQIHATDKGDLYLINSEGLYIKLPYSIEEAVNKSPFYLSEFPDTLIVGSKKLKLYQVVQKDEEYFIEELPALLYGTELDFNRALLGKFDYSLEAVNFLSGEIMWNLNFTQYSGLNVANDSLEIASSGLKEKENALSIIDQSYNHTIVHSDEEENSEENECLDYDYNSAGTCGTMIWDFIINYYWIAILVLSSMVIGIHVGRLQVEKIPCEKPRNTESTAPSESLNKDSNQLLDNFDATEHKIYPISKLDLSAISSAHEVSVFEESKNSQKSPEFSEHSVAVKENSQINNEASDFTKSSSESSHYKSFDDPKIPNKELRSFLDDGHYKRHYKYQRILGSGGFASVHLAEHNLDDQLYAIKIVKMQINPEENIKKHKLFSEVNAIKQLQSKYIVRYITCWAEKEPSYMEDIEESEVSSSYIQSATELSSLKSSNNLQSSKLASEGDKMIDLYLYIQMEYCDGMNLREWLDQPNHKIDRERNLQFFTQMLKGIKYIHEHAIIHRDLKPANIFINGKDNVKIGDLGLARVMVSSEYSYIEDYTEILKSALSMNIGTPLYLAPEQEFSTNYNHKVDIFSLGIILLELSHKFETYHERYRMLKDVRESHTFPTEFIKNYPIEHQIVMAMTEPDPKNRPEAIEILKGELIKNWEKSL